MKTLLPLELALTPVARQARVDASLEYSLLGVRLDGRGAFLRETIPGSATSAKYLTRVETGDFIYSRLFAWRGAFAVVPEALNGCWVSNEFPTFRVAEDLLDPSYLLSWFRVRATLDRIYALSTGSTAVTRNRLRPERLLALEIPMRPLQEQMRVGALLENVARRLSEAATLRSRLIADCERLCQAIMLSDQDAVATPLGSLLTMRAPDVIVDPGTTYQFAGVFSFGRGVFRADRRDGVDTKYPRLTRIRAGEFVYPKLMAWEGAFGVVPEECDGCVVSTEFPVFEIDETRILPEVLDTYFRVPSVWKKIAGSSTGTNIRRRRLNPRDFLLHQLPLPTRRSQELVRAVRMRIQTIRRLQSAPEAQFTGVSGSLVEAVFRDRAHDVAADPLPTSVHPASLSVSP